jgi:hypothetical protein
VEALIWYDAHAKLPESRVRGGAQTSSNGANVTTITLTPFLEAPTVDFELQKSYKSNFTPALPPLPLPVPTTTRSHNSRYTKIHETGCRCAPPFFSFSFSFLSILIVLPTANDKHNDDDDESTGGNGNQQQPRQERRSGEMKAAVMTLIFNQPFIFGHHS